MNMNNLPGFNFYFKDRYMETGFIFDVI